jgi:hypothetical protein
VTDDSLPTLQPERFDLRVRGMEPLIAPQAFTFTHDQLLLFQREAENLRFLWTQPNEVIVRLLLPADVVAQLECDAAARGVELPQMFAIEPDGSPLQLAIERRIAPLHSPLYDLVCVKWNYCEKRTYADWLFRLALLALASLLTGGIITDVPMSPAIIAAIRWGYFDRLCECGPSKAGDA